MNATDKYYAKPAALPHQKGKWAVWVNDAQIQGTLTDSEDEAKAQAEAYNKAEQQEENK